LGVIRIKKGCSGGNPKDLGIMAGKCLGAGHIAVGVDVDDPGEDVGEILERIDIVEFTSLSRSVRRWWRTGESLASGLGQNFTPLPTTPNARLRGPALNFGAATEGPLIDRHEYLMVGVSGEVVVEFLASGLPHRRQL
jgi:hypothetical protein